jgi:hypothetical protein
MRGCSCTVGGFEDLGALLLLFVVRRHIMANITVGSEGGASNARK